MIGNAARLPASILAVVASLAAVPAKAAGCAEAGAAAWRVPGEYRLLVPDLLAECELVIRLRGAGGGSPERRFHGLPPKDHGRGGDGAFLEISLKAPVGAELTLTVGAGGGQGSRNPGDGGHGSTWAGNGGSLTKLDLAGTPLAIAGAGGGGGGGGQNDRESLGGGGNGGHGGFERGADGGPGLVATGAGKGAVGRVPGAKGFSGSQQDRGNDEDAADGRGFCCGGGGGAGWAPGGGGYGNPERGGERDFAGGGGGGGSGFVDTRRATIRAARLGGGGRGGVDGLKGQAGGITIAWGPPGRVGGTNAAMPGGGRGGVEPLLNADTKATISLSFEQIPVGALPLPDEVDVHMVTVYDGGDGHPVRLSYDSHDKPFVLLLGSFGPVDWDLGRPPPTLRGLLIATEFDRAVSVHRVPPGMPVRRLPVGGYLEQPKECIRLTAKDVRCTGSTFAEVLRVTRLATGRSLTSWVAAYHAEGVLVVPGDRIVGLEQDKP